VFWLFLTLLAICGGIIAYQDFKDRMISLWLILVFTGINIAQYLLFNPFYQFLENVIFCLCYFLLCFLVLALYFFLKNREFESIIDKKIGWGDILIFLAIGFTIQPLYMIWFFTGVFIISLLFHVFLLRRKTSVPLAGFAAIIYLLYLLTGILFSDFG
jgi:hypothetical protein